MAWELDVVAVSASAFTALGVGIKSLWDRFWNRRERKEEREAARDEVHRNELRKAYAELVIAFHKMIDDGFALVMVFLEHNQTRLRTEEAVEAAKLQRMLSGVTPVHVMAAYEEVDQRAKKVKRAFFDGRTEVLGKATAVQFLDDDIERGIRVLDLARESVPPLEQVEHADRFRDELTEQRARFDELIESLGGAFAPRRWDKRALAAPTTQAQLPPGQPKI